MSKAKRNMKVYGTSGYQYRSTPTIILKGQWLKDLGFDIGGYVSVGCENGRLVITPDFATAAIKEAEASFMAKEAKKLQKRFEAEKKRIQMQFVAEGAAQYGSEEQEA